MSDEQIDINKMLDATYEFLKKVMEKFDEGKWLVFVDEKLVKWIDEQVKVGKYRDRSHAIEVMILKEMKGEQ